MNCCDNNCNQGRNCPEQNTPINEWSDSIYQQWAEALSKELADYCETQPILNWKQRIYNFIARIWK